jgi:hypothetical protein
MRGETVSIETSYQRSVVWLYLGGVIVGFVGLTFVAGLIPPPSPDLPAASVAAFYRSHSIMFRLGMLMFLAGAMPMLPFFMIITAQLQRIARCPAFLTHSQMSAAIFFVLLAETVPIFFVVNAFRPNERSPELIGAFHDLAWLISTVPFSLVIVHQLAIAFAIFTDNAGRPVFPRWVGHVNIITGLLYLPLISIPFSPAGGAFGWSGSLSFWLPLSSFGIWNITMVVMLLKAIEQQKSPQGVGA